MEFPNDQAVSTARDRGSLEIIDLALENLDRYKQSSTDGDRYY